MKRLAILGSTGSIGEQTLDVVAAAPDRFEVVALAAGRRIERLIEQARRFAPRRVSVADPRDASVVRAALGPEIEVTAGEPGLIDVATEPAELVVAGLVLGLNRLATRSGVALGTTVRSGGLGAVAIGGLLFVVGLV